MKKREQFVVFLLVGVMTLSVLGIVAVGLTGDSGSNGSGASSADELDPALQAQLDATVEADKCDTTIIAADRTDVVVPSVNTFTEDITELATTDIVVGTGAEAGEGACVIAHYHGTLATDGTVFDSSYERNEPIGFPLTGVIEGWQQGVPGMKEGGVRELVIPSELAYGEFGTGATIGPNADLVFTVKLVRVVPTE